MSKKKKDYYKVEITFAWARLYLGILYTIVSKKINKIDNEVMLNINVTKLFYIQFFLIMYVCLFFF
jgi:hypothetical protein